MLAGAFAPSRAGARMVETRAQNFFATATETRQETAPQVADPHQGNLVCGYELASGYSQAAESRLATVATPHGLAVQADTAAARAALQQAQSGATVYRQGSLGVQNTADAQFWSFNNPARTPGYSGQMGMPGGAAKPDWIMGGTVRPNSPVITRPAPGIGTNTGGNIEAVVPPGGVGNTWFHMPD